MSKINKPINSLIKHLRTACPYCVQTFTYRGYPKIFVCTLVVNPHADYFGKPANEYTGNHPCTVFDDCLHCPLVGNKLKG
jgi:hypothetical protein